MAKASFFLKEPTSADETLVYLFFNFNNQRLKYSTGEKIKSTFWNLKEMRARETSKFPEALEFNARLDKMAQKSLNIYRKLYNDETAINLKTLKEEFDKEFRKHQTESTHKDFFSFVDKFIEEGKGVKSELTLKSYSNTLKHLKNFGEFRKSKFNFEDIDLAFYNEFISYLTNELKFSQNSIGSQIKILKTFLNEATERGINKNLEFKKRKFRKVYIDTDTVYLNTTELENLYNLDLSSNKKFEKVRDLFIVGCYTGLRFSDFIQIKQENVFESNKIKIRTQKTGEMVVIPLHPFVREIMAKYDGKIPEPISNQKMNDYLKDIAELAELKELIEVSITKGGKMVKSTTEKFNLIMTHTARRSFATNLFMADVPSITIMKITGHKTEKNFLRYIRISQEENANKLLNHPFFN
ncbi:MAG: site-specific integrase [Bacteroidota bacterium]|nr:site-specific integrase [Bacteroidota bacterium]